MTVVNLLLSFDAVFLLISVAIPIIVSTHTSLVQVGFSLFSEPLNARLRISFVLVRWVSVFL